jgi:myosin heavy subunit
MSRRAQRPELEFGSDSFLDVVCNIVGILIILIVVVGLKVQRQPREQEAQATVKIEAMRVDQETILAERQRTLEQLNTAEAEAAEAVKLLESQSAEAEERIRQAMEAQELANQQMLALQEKADRTQKQAADLESDKAAIAARVASLKAAIDEKSREALNAGKILATAMKAEQDLSQKLETTVVETQELRELLEKAEEAAVPKNRMQHRLSPVTKPAENEELHFRVSEGRISRVPLEELLERLKDQVMTRRTAVMRFNQFDGVVGPVDGYTMSYTVEKDGPSTLEALQSGDGITRLNVTRWTITPDESLVAETIEEAVRPGSRYRQRIETALPDSVVTMWVYPDSFKGFSTLREVAHGLQLRVAARPLPEGTPIVGSPSGSRSTAQ